MLTKTGIAVLIYIELFFGLGVCVSRCVLSHSFALLGISHGAVEEALYYPLLTELTLKEVKAERDD